VKRLKRIINIVLSDRDVLSPKHKRNIMLLLQAIFGLLWLEGASCKVIVDGKFMLNYDALRYWVSRGSEYPVIGAYKWIIDHAIIPNIKLFLPMVFIIELTIGILFITGKYIRIAAMLAVAQTIAITLSVLRAPNEWKWSYFLMLVVSIIFFVSPTISKWPNKLIKK
jgi:thiosulfate dehydrogenase (quinone) large subunit